jgi:hypothetical protein
MNVNPLSYFTATTASPASSVQQKANVLGSSADQFLNQLQQVQSPQQYQAMISQMSGEPIPSGTVAPASTGPTAQQPPQSGLSAHHCHGGGKQAFSSTQASAASANPQNQSLLASLFGSINPSQAAAL